jgi:hypothetical protein
MRKAISKSIAKPSQRIHDSFPPMGNVAPLSNPYSPPVDASNINFNMNRQPTPQSFGVLNSAQ